MKKIIQIILASLFIAVPLIMSVQSKAGADNHSEIIPFGNYSVHVPTTLGNSDKTIQSYLSDKSNLKWNHWSAYTDGKKDYVFSTPTTTKELATDLLKKICDKDPDSGAIAFNQASGQGISRCENNNFGLLDAIIMAAIMVFLGIALAAFTCEMSMIDVIRGK